jgi:hypothetical protein
MFPLLAQAAERSASMPTLAAVVLSVLILLVVCYPTRK